MLRSVKTSVTGAQMVVSETIDGLRSLFLDDHVQSEIQMVQGASVEDKERPQFAKQEPLELVQVMSLVTLGWIAQPEKLAGTSDASRGAASRVLLIGVGGGSIANVLLGSLPPEARLHLVELEPEVLQAAVDFFGVNMVAPRCTGEAADGATVMRTTAERCRAARAVGEEEVPCYDVLLLDAFTKDGLAESTQQKSTLDDAAACLSERGLLVVNLHTGDEADPDFKVARKVLRSLAVRFDAVYSVLCSSTLNLIALCHQGELIDADQWETRLRDVLRQPEVAAACSDFNLDVTLSRFDFVGGKTQQVERTAGLWVPPP